MGSTVKDLLIEMASATDMICIKHRFPGNIYCFLFCTFVDTFETEDGKGWGGAGGGT